jgi:hypothetical protein
MIPRLVRLLLDCFAQEELVFNLLVDLRPSLQLGMRIVENLCSLRYILKVQKPISSHDLHVGL